MRHSTEIQMSPAFTLRGLAYCIVAVASLSLAIGTVSASVPTSDELGVRFKVLKSGPTATVEIRMTPRRDFDSVIVEAASGVASLTPTCGFSNVAVVAGGSYVCRVDVTGKPSDAAMTLNVVARRSGPVVGLPEIEMHHLSIKNAAFVPAMKNKSASHHDVADSSPSDK